MNSLIQKWNHYWFKPWPVVDLAVFRVIAVGAQLSLLLTRFPVGGEFARLHANAETYWPLVVLRLLTLPFGWDFLPSVSFVSSVFWGTVLAGFLGFLGLFTNVSLILFAIGSVFIQAFLYSFNDIHHPQAIMMFALTVLALSPCGQTLSLDALRRDRASFFQLDKTDPFARWPLLFVQWFFVLIYFSATYLKFRRAGWDWINGFTLQYYLLEDGLRWERPLGLWMAQQHGIAVFMSVLTLVFEGTFFLVQFLPKLLWIYLPLGLSFHFGIYILMDANFTEFLVLYCVFIPWSVFLKKVYKGSSSQ